MKKIFFVLFFTNMILLGSAQGILQFDNRSHDFGEIEEGSIASYEFVFKNTGNQPIVIDKVEASCGCTTPSYTRKPVKPGETGKIKASFNSNGRPGGFNKSVKVFSNANGGVEVLFIKGNVNPRANYKETKQTKNDPSKMGLIQYPEFLIGKKTHDFGRVENRGAVTERFIIKNNGKGFLEIQGFASLCQCIRYGISTNNIYPGKTATLTLTYKPTEVGKLKEVFTIYTNDPKNKEFPITLSADVYENFSKAMFVGRKNNYIID